MSGYLTLADGSHRAVHDGFSIGRVAGCDLVIDDSKASRRHARFVVASGVVEIEDLDSSNGTLLNDKPVQRRIVRDGDQVKIGKTVLVYHEGTMPGAERAAGAARVAGGAAASPVLSDDDDLLADGPAVAAPVTRPAPAAPPLSQPPSAQPPSAPRPVEVVQMPSVAPKPAPPAGSPPVAAPMSPPAAARKDVVEFADEVVEVRRAAPAAPAAGKPTGDGKQVVSTGSRVLQFHKQEGGGGLLGDDLGQLGGGMRALLLVGVLALSAGLVWLVLTLMQ